MNSIRKYFVGILVLSLLTIVLAGFVLSQAIGGKQDVQTLKAAQSAAEKLNKYTDSNGVAPASLAKAGIKDQPSTIRYTKTSDTEYKFCVSYKTSTTISGSDFTRLITFYSGGIYASDGTGYPGFYPTSSYSLYITPDHKKGENCQTVQIYPVTSPDTYPQTDLCSPTGPNYNLYKDYCQPVNTPAVNTN